MPKFEQVVWVVTWPKGTTEEWRIEGKSAPKSFEPIHAEVLREFMYKSKREKRRIYGDILAVFDEPTEAAAWVKVERLGKSFVIRKAKLTVF